MSSSTSYPLLLAAAVAHSVLALGHTMKGLDQFKHASMQTLPVGLRGAVQAGWYEGSVFFGIMGILNYKWATTGLLDVCDKSIAALLVSLLLGASLTYARGGDKSTAFTLATVAVLQGLGAKGAAV